MAAFQTLIAVWFTTCATTAMAAGQVSSEPAVKLTPRSLLTSQHQRQAHTVHVRVQLSGAEKARVKQVLVFAHSEGFALLGKPLTVPAHGRLSVDVRVSKEVDRIVLMPVPAGFKLEHMTDCTAHHCVGQIDVVDQRIVPFAAVWRNSQLAIATAPSKIVDPELARLEARMSLMPIAGAFAPAALVRGDIEREVVSTIDQATYALTMLRARHIDSALPVLNALANLQRGDGSFSLAYTQSGTAAAILADERVDSTVAWANLAFATYAELTHNQRFSNVLARGRQYLTLTAKGNASR